MSEPARQESPLVQCRLPAGPVDGGPAGVVLKEIPFQAHFNLRGDPGDAAFLVAVEDVLGLTLPTQANTIIRRPHLRVAWLGPDEWLMIVTPDNPRVSSTQLAGALATFHHALNDLSGGQTIISVSGPHALDVLAKGCTLDMHPRVFGPGQCAQSHLAKCSVLIIPHATNLSGYDVVVRRSFADYLWQWLVKAGSEYGIAAS